MRRLLILVLLVAPLTIQAQIYRTTDEHGNVVFTDTPSAGSGPAERIDIRDTNTTPPPPSPAPSAVPQQSMEEADQTATYSVAITSPANETSFPMGPGNFSVSAKVDPNLRGTESLQLYIGGIPSGEAQRAASWALTNVFRGAHDLTVAVVDAQGQQLAISAPVRVFVHRPSVNFRNRN